MKLQDHYNSLFHDSIKKIQSNSYQVDELIDSKTDKRFGVTLLLRPDKTVSNSIQEFLSKLKLAEPNQYYYPNSDLHVTVMSIISCYDGFKLSQIKVEDYIETVKKSIQDKGGFNIKLNGLTASPSCVMLQGFLESETLNQIRDELRVNFKNSGLEQSIDKRYAIQTAHSTVFRLKEEFQNKEEFLKIINEYRNHYFGSFKVDSLELVCNDWYQRKDHVKKLYHFHVD